MSFLNPLFLLGLAAVAVPIIVHLVRRTKAPRVEFPSLMFVRRVPQRTIRRRQLTNLLLLLLRTLAFLLIVLAFVRPYFSSSDAANAENRTSTAILLDTSFSMQAGDRFEQARNRASRLVDEARNGDRVALITFDQNFDIQSRFSTDNGKLKSLIAQLKPGAGATDFAQALRGAENLFKEAPTRRKRICLISDFQASGRLPAEAAYRLNSEIELVPIDVGAGDLFNLSIADVSALPAIYQPKYTDKVSARIVNHSDQERQNVRVEFQLNDRTVEKREIRIPAGNATTVEFTGFNLIDGTNRGMITVEGDEFPLDNRFFIKFRRDAQLKALVIETATRGRSESFYLRNAMTTGENLPFSVDVKTGGTISPSDINKYEVIFLNDAGSVSPALASQLSKFVEGGGGLIAALGPHTDSDTATRLFQNVWKLKVEQPVQLRGDYVALSEIKTDHPVFEVFRQSGRLTSARVFGYHRVTPQEGAAVIARYEDGSPALIESAFGSGKALVFTSTLDAGWNDLPLTPIYLPLIRQMTRYLADFDDKAWQTVGSTFTIPPGKDGTAPAVDTPDGTRLTEKNLSASGELLLNPKQTGFYRIRYSESGDFAAVNPVAREADFTRLDVGEFVKTLTGAKPDTATAADADAKLSPEEEEGKQRVWWLLLIAALALFIAEAVIARRTKMVKVIN